MTNGRIITRKIRGWFQASPARWVQDGPHDTLQILYVFPGVCGKLVAAHMNASA